MSTEDKIGELLQKLVVLEQHIQRLEYMGQGATHPEMLGAYHQQIHEDREQRKQLRAELLVLKQMHRTELIERKAEVEKEMESHTTDAWDVEELKEMLRNINRKVEIITDEIKLLSE